MSIIKGVSAHFECASDLFRLGGLVRILTTALLCGCSASMATAGVNEFTELGPEGGLVNEIAFHPLDASIAYVGTGSGFYRSSNGGATWQLVSDSFINIPSDVAVHPTSPNHVFVVSSGGGLYSSTDDGLTLNQVSTLPSMATTGEVEVGSDGTLYVSTSDRLFWSDNLGATWHESSPVPPTDTAINLLRVDPSHPETVYVRTASTSIFRSDDRGSNWTAIDVPAVAGVNDIAIAGTVPARIWLATTAGVWSKLDAGDASWESMPIGAAFLTVDVNPSDPSKVYAGTSAGLYASEDAGGHWFIVNDGSHTGQFTTLAIAPSAPTQLLLGGFGGMEGSLDAGIHWVSRNSGVLGANVQTLYAAAASDRIYVQTSHNGLQFIDGETLSLAQLDNQELRAFHALPSLFGTRAVHVVSEAPDELLLAIGPGIARSLDGGESWQLQSVPAFVSEGVRSVESAIVEDAPVFLALTSAGLYRSTDQGISWPKVLGLEGYEALGPAIESSLSNRAVVFMAAQASANDSVLLKSEDGGATWHPTSLTLAGFILSVAVNPTDEREIYTGTTDGVRKSIDGGSTWVSLSVPSVNPVLALALDPQNPDIVFAAQGGVLGRSVDAGEQWEVLPTPSEPYSWLVRALAVDPLRPHRLFAAPQSHGVKEISIAPDLAIAMSPSSLHEPLATPNAFTIEVTNEGPFDATNVTTTIVLTGALSEIEANVSGGSCASTANSVTCTHPVLRRDVSREILLNLTYSQAGGATIAAIVEGDQPDPVENNNSTELSFEVVELADLNVDLSGATALTEGETATYTATVRNEGPNVATNVSVQLQFASAVAIATAVPSKGTCAAVVGGRIECTIPSLSPDESATVSFVTRALPMGTHTSTVSVSASGIDPVSHNSDSSISTLVSSLPAPEIPPPSTETPPPEEVPPPPTEPPPSTDSPPPTAGTPPSRSAGGGGGGGSSSGLLLGLLAAFASLRRKAGMRRDGGVPGLNI